MSTSVSAIFMAFSATGSDLLLSAILAARLIGAANAEEVVALDLLSFIKTVFAQMSLMFP